MAAMQKRLTPDNVQALQTASQLPIVNATATMRTFFAKREWIDRTNVFRVDTIDEITKQSKSGNWNVPDLEQYIAASCSMHCFDGWSFLGKAIQSHIHGDIHTAIHLAYYAELRAAMSILASRGIGVFNTTHVVLDSTGTSEVIKGLGTHDFVWLALKWWSDQSTAWKAITDAISVGGSSLTSWLLEYGYGYRNPATASEWLTAWSMDLHTFSSDHFIRNITSYRPSAFQNTEYLKASNASRVLYESWRMLEPDQIGGFPELDQYLLRSALEQAFRLQTQKRVQTDPADFAKRIDSMLNRLGIAGDSALRWRSFITRQHGVSIDPLLMRLSLRACDSAKALGSASILARSTLLLRIATGLARANFLSAGISYGDIEHWTLRVAKQLGFVSDEQDIAHPADMWEDVNFHLEGLDQWQEDKDHINSPRSMWFKENSGALLTLAGTERVALWGMAP